MVDRTSIAFLKFVREHNINKLVLGKPGRKSWRRWLLGSVVDTITSQAHGINFYLLGDEYQTVSISNK